MTALFIFNLLVLAFGLALFCCWFRFILKPYRCWGLVIASITFGAFLYFEYPATVNVLRSSDRDSASAFPITAMSRRHALNSPPPPAIAMVPSKPSIFT